MELQKALQRLNLGVERYLALWAAPTVAGHALLAVALAWLFGDSWPALFRWVLVPLVGLGVGAILALLIPTALLDRRKQEINEAIPFFMTHLGVLATSNMARAEMIRILGEQRKYKGLAEEMARIHGLVANWNLSLPEACRFVSKTTPSEILSDFLERFAHALDTGQDMEHFTRSEQIVVMKDYATFYETAIYRLEQLKDIYLSTMMSGVFLVIFAIITPVITGGNPAKMLYGILFFFVFMEVLFVVLVKMRSPNDRLWHRLDIDTMERARIRTFLGVALGLAVALGLVLTRFSPLPLMVALAIAATPAAVVGVYAERVERRIRRREENYAAFVRSLGASAAARGGSLRDVLRKLVAHNFGPLTLIVQRLYARLAWRLQDMRAWKHFSAESGSNLVENFSDMFVEGIRSGGKPDAVGAIISENVVRIMNLRKSRYSTAGTFRGLLFGFTAGMAMTMFIGVGMMESLSSMFGSINLPEGASPIGINFDMDPGVVDRFLSWLLLFHALMAAWMLKLIDGGNYPAGLGNFVIMLWMGVGIAYASSQMMQKIFGGG